MLKVAYTATGKRLHMIDVEPERRSGPTLCGRYGFVHPHFTSPATAVRASLSFNDGCQTCIREHDRREGD